MWQQIGRETKTQDWSANVLVAIAQDCYIVLIAIANLASTSLSISGKKIRLLAPDTDTMPDTCVSEPCVRHLCFRT